MRAPGEATGSIALESAIDEAAWACGMDPLAFRIKNYAEVEPISGKPFSSKALRECYAQGAERFGWSKRPLAPRQLRDEAGFLVGWGMGTATFPALMFQAEARAVVRGDGSGLMETGAHDMGQGAWTALAQIAADGLGLDLEQVEFRAGTSDLPDAGIAGGSAHTATAGMAIHNAGAAVIAKLADLATGDERSPLFGAGNAGVVARDGRLFRRDDESAQRELCRYSRPRRPRARSRPAARAPPTLRRNPIYAMHAHGAVFAEVKVDPDLGQIRVTRLVGAFAAGRGHQSSPGAQSDLRRHDLGRVVCAARAGRHGPPLRPDAQRQPCGVPRPCERRRAEPGGADDRRARSPRERARHQGRR